MGLIRSDVTLVRMFPILRFDLGFIKTDKERVKGEDIYLQIEILKEEMRWCRCYEGQRVEA